MDLRFVDIPKIENDSIFEDLIKDIYTQNIKFESVNINGISGQKQDGIDIFAREINSFNWIGIQCKVRSKDKTFTKKEIYEEINQVYNFNPKISKYYLYTTLSRDVKVQAIEREIVDELKSAGNLYFKIQFWEDIEQELKLKENEEIYFRYYHKYFVDNLSLGHAIGKLVNLELAFNNQPDTHCEFIIGKIPTVKNSKGTCADYFRGTYFIIDLLNKKIEFFNKDENTNKAKCFPSDIEYAIDNKIDSYRISKWLESIENIDDFIYNNNYRYTFSITEQDRKEYLDE